MGERKKYPSTTRIWITGHSISGQAPHLVFLQEGWICFALFNYMILLLLFILMVTIPGLYCCVCALYIILPGIHICYVWTFEYLTDVILFLSCSTLWCFIVKSHKWVMIASQKITAAIQINSVSTHKLIRLHNRVLSARIYKVCQHWSSWLTCS